MVRDEEQKQWADSVPILFPEFEGGGTHVNVSGVAMVQNAPHRDDALWLMEFLTSPQGQELYARLNNGYPIAARSRQTWCSRGATSRPTRST